MHYQLRNSAPANSASTGRAVTPCGVHGTLCSLDNRKPCSNAIPPTHLHIPQCLTCCLMTNTFTPLCCRQSALLLPQVFDCTSMMQQQQQQPQEYVLPWPTQPSSTALEASRDPMKRRLQVQHVGSQNVSAACVTGLARLVTCKAGLLFCVRYLSEATVCRSRDFML
jgi:hypothetical protein